MSTQVVPFNDKQLPAHLAAGGSLALNSMAEAFASVSFPSISIKGKTFHIIRADSRTLITRPAVAGQPLEPASAIEVVVLNIQRAKSYYEDSYVEGSEEKPTCFSNDGVTPDASAEDKQSDTCAVCPHNAWGSGRDDKGNATKGKACSDVQRTAVASPANLDDPFLLRIPPASLKGLAGVAKTLSGRNIPLNGVVMRVNFDTDAASPVLVFTPVGYLDADSFAKAQALQDSELVLTIVGKKQHTAPITQPVTNPKVAEVAAAAVTKTKKATAVQVPAEPTSSFGAPAGEAAQSQVTETASVKVVASSDFDAELANLLGA